MYHCHVDFHIIGEADHLKVFEKAAPLNGFTHSFEYSGQIVPERLAQADVVIACLHGQSARLDVIKLMTGKKMDAQLIVLGDEGLCEELAADMAMFPLGGDTDFWRLPMSEKEMLFRFARWQKAYKREKDLWEKEQFLEACINGSPDLVWYKTEDGIYERVNYSFCRTADKPREQVEGQSRADIWDIEQDDPACTDSEAMRTRETKKSTETVQTGKGKMILTTYESPLYDLDGSVMGTVGVGIDVTKERTYERQLNEKSQTLEKIFATMDCGVLCHSLNGKEIISVNEAALRLLGYRSEQDLVRGGFDLAASSVVKEDVPLLRQCVSGLKKVGDSANVEFRVRHEDGKLLHILCNMKLMEENGECFFQRFLLDVTDQKLRDEERSAQKDREIKYQEALFEIFSSFLADNIDDVYMMLDGQGEHVEFASSNVKRVLGVSGQELEKDLSLLGEVIYLTTQGVGRQELRELKPGMSLPPMETERVHKPTGERKRFQESVYCVQVQGTRKLIVYISDRTEERKTQDTLAAALEMVQVASRAKSTFLSNVSHDIRTPMNAIMGFLPLLQEEADNKEHVLEYTAKISAASHHLLGLINSVLDMNKIENGSAVLNITGLSLPELIDELNATIRPQTRAKGQSFQIYTSALTCEHLLGDKLRVNQILLNILTNAVKYTQEGGRIEMRVLELPWVDENYRRIRFTISDNGQGMSQEYLQILFDPFTRELSTGINKIQGAGLGMAITKSLVELMGGSIDVESSPGEGSTFTVELELRVQPQEDDPKFWYKHGIQRMIVADDDEDICRDIAKKMDGTGVQVDFATDGRTAVEKIRSARDSGEHYDLILLDWKMPNLNGVETVKLLRDKYQDKIPILLFTAYDWNDIKQEANSVGVEQFLQKPFFLTNFKESVDRMGMKRESLGIKSQVVKDKRILVVDDIDVNRLVLAKILSNLGAQCDMAENGKVALDKFTALTPESYDIIMMDVQMPIMNGYEATRAIRASGHPQAEKVAIVAITANAFVDDVRNALNAGMDAHIAKPIVINQLTDTLEEVLESKA